jgi:hypothetical protein
MSALDPALLREIGVALDGTRWYLPMARRRQVAQKTVSRWDRGEFRIPPAVAAELAADIEAKIAELRALRRKLR